MYCTVLKRISNLKIKQIMKTKHILAGLVSLVLFALQTYAQEIDFDLKSYKTTDYTRSSLDLTFGLSESNTGTSEKGNTNNLSSSQNSFQSNGSLKLDYFDINFSRKKIVTQKIQFDGYFSSSKNRTMENEIEELLKKNLLSSNILSLSRSYINYYGGTNNFWKYSANFNMSINSNSKLEQSSSITTENNGATIQPLVSLYLGHGHGRLENIENAVEAIYILSELGDLGITRGQIGSEAITALADKITKLTQVRYFDSRIYRKEVMSELVSLLKSEGLVEKESVDLFNVLNDYHFMVGIKSRLSGAQLQYGLSPYMKYYSTNYADGSSQQLNDGVVFNVTYDIHKPINLKWQRQFLNSLNLDFGYANYKSGDTEDWGGANRQPLELTTTTSYSIGYYPNTRTFINTSAFCTFNWNKLLNFPKKDYNNADIDAGLNINGYYYLSEKIRLNGTFRLFSNFNKDILSTINNSAYEIGKFNLNQSFNISLNYFIF